VACMERVRGKFGLTSWEFCRLVGMSTKQHRGILDGSRGLVGNRLKSARMLIVILDRCGPKFFGEMFRFNVGDFDG